MCHIGELYLVLSVYGQIVTVSEHERSNPIRRGQALKKEYRIRIQTGYQLSAMKGNCPPGSKSMERKISGLRLRNMSEHMRSAAISSHSSCVL